MHTVDKETLHLLIKALGTKAAVEITGLCGYYTMVAMTLNAFGVGTDGDAPIHESTHFLPSTNPQT